MRHKSPVHGEGNARVKGADRTSVSYGGRPKRSVPLRRPFGTVYPPSSLWSAFISRRPMCATTCSRRCSSSSFVSAEVTDLLTIARGRDGTRRTIAGSVGRRKGRSKERFRRDASADFSFPSYPSRADRSFASSNLHCGFQSYLPRESAGNIFI